MNKQTKNLLGLAVLVGVGYYAYSQYKKPKVGFANAAGSPLGALQRGCPCQKVSKKDYPAKGWDTCAGGQACPQSGPYQPY